LNNRQVFNF